jgi:outer membrane protein assembly factor BamA
MAKVALGALALTFICGMVYAQKTIESVRVHGNHTIPDDEVIGIAGVSPGDSLGDNSADEIEERLLDSGRFESVEVRVRYRSLDENGPVALVIVVREGRGKSIRSIPRRFMLGPIFRFSDEYGVTFGANVAMVDLFTKGGRASFPLSWGGKRQIAAKFHFPLGESDRGKVVHNLLFDINRYRQVNPHFDVPDNRFEVGGGVQSRYKLLSFGARGDWTDASFDELDESFVKTSAHVALDTRVDEIIPGHAVYLGLGWERFFFRTGTDRADVNRYSTDVRGFLHLIGPLHLAGQFYYNPASGPLPTYEKPFLGGGATLRGHEAGEYIGDNMALATIELRLAATRLLQYARVGLHFFYDAGTVYDFGEKLRDATWHEGAGLGAFFRVFFISVRADVGWNLQGEGTRFHIASKMKF